MAKKEKDLIDEYIENILPQRLEDIVGERFGRYSKYIIQDRAIPDVRDGLKPVQRRILYAMYNMRILSNSGFKKCARIAGEVMGKYHPHGDSSIYEALIHMSQDWKMGVGLIEVHGNNGSIDGDSPAAMRYTEARLTKNAEYLLQDLEKKTVAFAPNFDDEELEPTVLPSKFPNILVNGATGISAGYATAIPPHNISEVVEAAIRLIENPNMTTDELLEIMKGPDFPTGGIVCGTDGIRDAFETGRGKIIIKSRVEFEDMNKDGQKRIVVTEIPYEVNKANLVRKIDQIRIDKTVEDILEVRDESDRTGLRIAIDLKKGANHEAILKYLYKNTDLQSSYNYNMVAIANHCPKCLGVIPILNYYIEHQKEVITNRCNFELEKAKKRIHILEGLIKMVDVLDEVIHTIRKSDGKADAKAKIMEAFGFTELQADAIVTLQLYRLSNTDVNALIKENEDLNKRVLELEKILSSEKELLKVIKAELREVVNLVGSERKTEISSEVLDLKVNEQHLVTKEDVMVCVTREGYIKRSSMKSFTSTPKNGLKENDAPLYCEMANTLDNLLVFTNMGQYYLIPVYKINDVKWKDLGNHLSSFDAMRSGEKPIKVIRIDDFEADRMLSLCTKNGLVKQVKLAEFKVSRISKTVKAMKISEGDELVSVDITEQPLELVCITKNCEAIRFRASEVSVVGTSASGVKACLLKPADEIVYCGYTNVTEDLYLLTTRSYMKRMRISEISLSRRARSTSPVIKKIKANPHLILAASTATPLQYKENVNMVFVCTLGTFTDEIRNNKYTDTEAGVKISIPNDVGTPLSLLINKAVGKEPLVNGDYLYEAKPVQVTIFDDQDEMPAEKTEVMSAENILDDLDAILAHEESRGRGEASLDKIKFEKINLFDDED